VRIDADQQARASQADGSREDHPPGGARLDL